MGLSEEITSNYFATTAGRNRELDARYYQEALKTIGGVPWLRPWLPADQDVPILDLGCGCGELLYALEQRGYTNLRGVDLCKDEVDQASRFTKATLFHADVLEHIKCCPTGSLGVVTALNLLEHLNDSKLLAVLREVQRALHTGGVLIAMVPNAISPFASITRYWDITHERAFTINNFQQLAAIAGFSPRVDMLECGPVPHGIKSAIRFGAWQVIRIMVASMLLVEVGDTKGRVYTMDMMVRLHRN